MLLSQALLSFSFFQLLRQYHEHPKAFLSIDCHVAILETFRNSFFGLLCQYLAHFKNSPSLDCYVTITRILVSRAHLGFSFIGFNPQDYLSKDCQNSILCPSKIMYHLNVRWYLVHLQNSLLFTCYVNLSGIFCTFEFQVSLLPTFGILFHSKVTKVQCLAHIYDFLRLDCYVSISRTFRVLFQSIVTLVSRAHLGLSF